MVADEVVVVEDVEDGEVEADVEVEEDGGAEDGTIRITTPTTRIMVMIIIHILLGGGIGTRGIILGIRNPKEIS